MLSDVTLLQNVLFLVKLLFIDLRGLRRKPSRRPRSLGVYKFVLKKETSSKGTKPYVKIYGRSVRSGSKRARWSTW